MTSGTNSQAAARRKLKRSLVQLAVSLVLVAALLAGVFGLQAQASISIDLGQGQTSGDTFGPLELLFFLALLALLPSILMMMTSFTRIVIVLSFLRNAMGTQQSPPNQVLIGLALFLTLFIMTPVLAEVKTSAYDPYRAGEMDAQQALDAAAVPIKTFMLKQVKDGDLELFLTLSGDQQARTMLEERGKEGLTDLSLSIIVPSFITSELKRAFQMGFLLFIPFLIIDIVVSSVLMSMGMVMLPPTMIALPFKLMMFVLVDGWGLLFGTLVSGFRL